VNALGNPDNGVILFSYIGSLFMAGGFLAIGSAVSAATRSQVIAFVVTAVVCFVFLLIGDDSVLRFVSSWAPESIVETISSFSFLARFEAISRGVIDLRDVIYFGSLIAAALTINTIALEARKA
jgi:ABC-2 type transport system permease protein